MVRLNRFAGLAAAGLIGLLSAPAVQAQATYPTGGTYPAQIPATVPLQCDAANTNCAPQKGDVNGVLVQYGLGQWNFTSGVTGILSNTAVAVTVQTAKGGAVRNFIDSCQIGTTAFGAAVPLAFRDGAAGAVIWNVTVPTAGFLQPIQVVFQTPLRGTANTLLEVVTPTANTSGSVMVNCQGHTGL